MNIASEEFVLRSLRVSPLTLFNSRWMARGEMCALKSFSRLVMSTDIKDGFLSESGVLLCIMVVSTNAVSFSYFLAVNLWDENLLAGSMKWFISCILEFHRENMSSIYASILSVLYRLAYNFFFNV